MHSRYFNRGNLCKLVLIFILVFCEGREIDDEHHERSRRHIGEADDTSSYGNNVNWKRIAENELEDSLKNVPNAGVAKNVIMFLGDGMGVSTVTAARLFKAQTEGTPVWRTKLSWEKMPYTGLSKTYNTDAQVADSAGTATAFLCGEKAQAGVICVNDRVPRGDCQAMSGNELQSILHHSIREGKWTGVVTTTRLTHATPSAAYAHSANRDWESSVPAIFNDSCKDIAYQLIHDEANSDIRVLFGGGRSLFYNNTEVDWEYPRERGHRTDGANLVQDWLDKKRGRGLREDSYKYVTNMSDFDALDPEITDFVLGLFEPSHMQYESERSQNASGEPSLTEMTAKAIEILKRGEQGYFLLVEGGRIDHAHHRTNAYQALSDTLEMSKACHKAMDLTDPRDTLIVVTADHSHTMTISGYQALDNHILGLAGDLAADNKPYLTLSYANGPGFRYHRTPNTGRSTDFRNGITPRRNITSENTQDPDYLQDAGIPLNHETHGGEDVSIFARGPMSHLLTGVHEQHYIAHVMAYASCVGRNKGHCAGQQTSEDQSEASILNRCTFLIGSLILIIIAGVF